MTRVPATGIKVHDLMAHLIDQYFADHLSLSWAEASRLHKEYYQSYGLAIEGLVRHHEIDPMEYNARVDDALPLEDIIQPNPALRALLADLDRAKVKPWLFTNAFVTHGRRVVRLLGVDDMFEGITFCDYASIPFVCKPHKDMFAKAMRDAGVGQVGDCFFVGECGHSFLIGSPPEARSNVSPPPPQTTPMPTAKRRRSWGGRPSTLSRRAWRRPGRRRPSTRSATWRS